jgi:hypothetical protein
MGTTKQPCNAVHADFEEAAYSSVSKESMSSRGRASQRTARHLADRKKASNSGAVVEHKETAPQLHATRLWRKKASAKTQSEIHKQSTTSGIKLTEAKDVLNFYEQRSFLKRHNFTSTDRN